MAIKHPLKKKNHFPDWLFYLISAALIVFAALFFNYYSSSSILNVALTNKTDSLNIERLNTTQLNSFYENQGKFAIQNSGSSKFRITDFYFTYYEKDKQLLTTVKGFINDDIEPGNTCKPFYQLDDKTVWDGSVLFYFISITGDDIYGNPKNRYFAGNWEKGKVLNISLNENSKDTSDRIYPKCGKGN